MPRMTIADYDRRIRELRQELMRSWNTSPADGPEAAAMSAEIDRLKRQRRRLERAAERSAS